MNFTVEKMNISHIPRIADLEKECFSQPWSENALADELKNESSHFLVALCDEVMGYIGVQEICGEAYITNVAVFDKYRKLGIGRALIKAACDGANNRNCEFITLEVRESNLPAISLYESEGFEKAGIRKNFYSSPTENGVIYTKYF
ncbi:MAG: ribosomal protein S18-alanine N-acetyltransferase [Acutalibacteraceae bacterium]|nr:ribosomal protein S18-alanine N-acetyltransferase [Acutalibacteraceae bacterium]